MLLTAQNVAFGRYTVRHFVTFKTKCKCDEKFSFLGKQKNTLQIENSLIVSQHKCVREQTKWVENGRNY